MIADKVRVLVTDEAKLSLAWRLRAITTPARVSRPGYHSYIRLS